jgi:hypothetical protein
MKLKLKCDWRQATREKFYPDVIRSTASVFRKKRLTCIVRRDQVSEVEILRSWLKSNQVSHYTMAMVYDTSANGVFYHGLAFDFVNETDALLFKLTFM